MNTLFIYMVKVSVYLTVFYLVFSLLLSRDTSYSRNRFFILASFALSLFLPAISLQTAKPLDIQFFGKFLSEVFISAQSSSSGNFNPQFSVYGVLQLIYSIYIIVALIFFIKFIIDLVNLQFLISRHKKEGSHIIRFNGFSTSGFSAMGYIFINTRLSPEDAGEIIRHEQNHLKQNHFFDIIFIELLKSFQWFNPVMYLFDSSLRAVHEYQADQECLSSGIPVTNYQSLILCQVFKSRAFNVTNSFSNPSLVKKRMLMMTKKRTSAVANMKLLTVIPLVAIVFFAISAYRPVDAVTTQNYTNASPPPPPPVPSDSKITGEEKSMEPFVEVDEMPQFPGGEGALMKYIAENTIYPDFSKNNHIQGRVIVRFCISEKGEVNRVGVIQGISADLDAEAIRVVKTLPLFKPGRQGGKDVPVWFMVPISFSLK